MSGPTGNEPTVSLAFRDKKILYFAALNFENISKLPESPGGKRDIEKL